MAVISAIGFPSKGIDFTQITDTSADFPSVANSTYFYNLADKIVRYKNSTGTILEIFSTSGGSGLQGIQVPFNNRQGQTSFGFNAAINASNVGNVGISASGLYLNPFTSNQTLNNCSLTIGVVTLGAGVLGRIIIYSNVDSFPTTKLYESTDIDCSTTGDKEVLANFTFTAGTTYWLGFYTNGTTTVRGISTTALLPLFLSNTGGSPIVSWGRVGTTLGTAPTTFNYNTYSQSSVVNIYIKPS